MKGLIFTAESVRGILAGKKTQTRRIISLLDGKRRLGLAYHADIDKWVQAPDGTWDAGQTHAGSTATMIAGMKPSLRVGDTVYVKETWCSESCETVHYRADGWEFDGGGGWRSPLMMPEWASRARLRITDVRLQRASAISEDDARAEGFKADQTVAEWVGITRPRSPEQLRAAGRRTAADHFLDAWSDMHGEQARDAWVWAYTFEVLK